VDKWASFCQSGGGIHAERESIVRRRLACGLLAVIGVVAAFSGAPAALAADGQTVVSLTFDDGRATQAAAGPILEARGMEGTFFVNSGTVGSSGRLTWGELGALQAAGHEIAGHTLEHVYLPGRSEVDLRWQICEDRARLLNRGFAVTNFAYPFGYGFADANVWGLVSEECWWCTAWAETIPPADAYGVLTAETPKATTSLDTIKGYITNAETHGGGWVILAFHDICDGCDTYGIPQSRLEQLLDWLKARESTGTVVRKLNDVIGGSLQPSPGTADTIKPAASTSCGGAACSAGWYTTPVQVALSGTDAGGSGFEAIRYTTDGNEPSLTSPVYSAPFIVNGTTTVRYKAWDNAGNVEPKSQLIQIDATAPTSSIACNGAACSSDAYSSPVTVTLAASDAAGGSGVSAIRYTLDGSEPTASSSAYSGPLTVAATTTVRFRAWDVAGNVEPTVSRLIRVAEAPPADTTPPTTSIACNGTACSASWYAAPANISLAAADDASGVAATRYTLDGSEPTLSSTPYTGPFTVSVTTTVRFRSWDNAGNVEPANAQLVQIDTQAPSVAITSPASGSPVKGNVKITASAGDALSGVARVDFYANGVLIGSKSGSPYFIAWQTNKLSRGQYTLTAVAYDAAGNSATSAPVTVTV
jgi:peptidoglycan/xylan/chitin deacetylase (PgdA/CDA1 family)